MQVRKALRFYHIKAYITRVCIPLDKHRLETPCNVFKYGY